jgi:hypothetical protein
MSKSKTFRVTYHEVMTGATEAVRMIREAADKELEALAVSMFGPAEECDDDGFGPPPEPCRVTCWHCGEKYNSSEMKREYRPRSQGAMSEAVGNGFSRIDPLWWCRNGDCDGAGFGHDIHPVKPRKPSKSRQSEAAQ